MNSANDRWVASDTGRTERKVLSRINRLPLRTLNSRRRSLEGSVLVYKDINHSCKPKARKIKRKTSVSTILTIFMHFIVLKVDSIKGYFRCSGMISARRED